MIYAFDPVVGNAPRALILGSMPSVKSLEENAYYGHPRNQFWKIIFELTGRSLSENHTEISYTEKLQCLKDSNIALWDVYAQCEREGSLDSNIKNGQCNDLEAFIARYPSLRVVLFNGGKAESAFRKHLNMKILSQRYQVAFFKMPSTSPAYTLPYEKKLDQWKVLSQYLG